MKWTRDRFSIEMLDEPTYSFASTDNVRPYDTELLLVRRDSVTSRHGLISFIDDARVASIVVGTGGGPTGVHERSENQDELATQFETVFERTRNMSEGAARANSILRPGEEADDFLSRVLESLPR